MQTFDCSPDHHRQNVVPWWVCHLPSGLLQHSSLCQYEKPWPAVPLHLPNQGWGSRSTGTHTRLLLKSVKSTVYCLVEYVLFIWNGMNKMVLMKLNWHMQSNIVPQVWDCAWRRSSECHRSLFGPDMPLQSSEGHRVCQVPEFNSRHALWLRWLVSV